MRRLRQGWWRLLLVVPLGHYVLGTSGCLGTALRDTADELNQMADDTDDRSDFDRFMDDLQDLFD
jgi:hypothetical protein